MSLLGKTAFITGGSRGIGHAIAVRLGREGCNVAIAAKTDTPHPKLPGTIHTACADVERVGGKALPLVVDVRSEDAVQAAIDKTVSTFGGIDFLINNASAIALIGTEQVSMKMYDLMHQVNGRGTFLCTKLAIPHLKKSAASGATPHVLNISPPLSMKPVWFAGHPAYTTAKYNMSMMALGHAEEFRADGVKVNCLWPRTAIATAAVEMLMGQEGIAASRTPEIMADAAHLILTSDRTGEFLVDDAVLLEHGASLQDLEKYRVGSPGGDLAPDFFLDGVEEWLAALKNGKIPQAKL
eukprot:TRINITY_DN2032_c0_g1_i4.p1 TRINITY_DN2032_c0_g1~~TRINITY_DN2032_c0_g1_i4.p1  ORF type:complete len:296 (+),score=70.06 TRINITY_DN2032_c0_g1_i4:122-1009(+)